MSQAEVPHGSPGAGTTGGRRLSRGQMVLAGALVALAVFLLWAVLSFGLSARFAAEGEPERALFWQRDNSDALVQLARREAEQGRLDAARQAALAALRADPMEYRALDVLSDVAQRSGDPGQADTLMRLAAARMFHDSGLQARLVASMLQQGDIDGAIYRIDALARTYPELQPDLFKLLAALAASPQIRPLVGNRLAINPPWRAAFLASLVQQPNTNTLTALITGLQASAAPPTEAEKLNYIAQLVKAAEYKPAHDFWLGTLDSETRALVDRSLLVNGDFKQKNDGSPFFWQIGKLPNVDIRIMRKNFRDEDNELRIEFMGGRVNFQHVIQTLLLPPGSYELQGQVSMTRLKVERGLVWRLYCLDPQVRRMLGQTSGFSGSSPWTGFKFEFVVPDDKCAAQRLDLVLNAKTNLDREISGRIEFANMRIDRVAPADDGDPPANAPQDAPPQDATPQDAAPQP